MYGFCSNNALYSASFSAKMFIISDEISAGVAYKSVAYKKAFNAIFQSSRNEEIILPHEFISVFIRYFIRTILMELSSQKWGVRKTFCTFRTLWCCWEAERGNLGTLNYLGDLNRRGDLIWKGGTSDPSSYHVCSYISYYNFKKTLFRQADITPKHKKKKISSEGKIIVVNILNKNLQITVDVPLPQSLQKNNSGQVKRF